MRFLPNVNVPPVLGHRLADAGHQCRHCARIGLSRAADAATVEEARTNGEAIITHDLDYGHLLAFSGQAAPSVIILRLRNTHPDNQFARLQGAWAHIEQPLRQGAITVLDDAATRIRALPLGSAGG